MDKSKKSNFLVESLLDKNVGANNHTENNKDKNFNWNYKNAADYSYGKQQRKRCSFTVSQINKLEAEFKEHRYLTGDQRLQLANCLQMTEQQVKIWFQNRRYKTKRRQVMDQVESITYMRSLCSLQRQITANLACRTTPTTTILQTPALSSPILALPAAAYQCCYYRFCPLKVLIDNGRTIDAIASQIYNNQQQRSGVDLHKCYSNQKLLATNQKDDEEIDRYDCESPVALCSFRPYKLQSDSNNSERQDVVIKVNDG